MVMSEKRVYTHIRVPLRLHSRIKTLAQEYDMSIPAFIESLLPKTEDEILQFVLEHEGGEIGGPRDFVDMFDLDDGETQEDRDTHRHQCAEYMDDLRTFDLEYMEKYLNGDIKVERDERLKGLRGFRKERWIEAHQDEIREFYRGHCPDATEKRFGLKGDTLRSIMLRMPIFPHLYRLKGDKS